jgi:hypothetical protein
VRDLAARGVEVLRTDRLGAVVVRTDGRTITISADGATWRAGERVTIPTQPFARGDAGGSPPSSPP